MRGLMEIAVNKAAFRTCIFSERYTSASNWHVLTIGKLHFSVTTWANSFCFHRIVNLEWLSLCLKYSRNPLIRYLAPCQSRQNITKRISINAKASCKSSEMLSSVVTISLKFKDEFTAILFYFKAVIADHFDKFLV